MSPGTLNWWWPNDNRIGHPILRIIEQYKNHPALLLLIIKMRIDNCHTFHEITKWEIALRPGKNLLTKITKANSDTFTEVIHKKLHKSLEAGKFRTTVKLANDTPAYEKDSRSGKGNHTKKTASCHTARHTAKHIKHVWKMCLQADALIFLRNNV